jgi:hypothetical protein
MNVERREMSSPYRCHDTAADKYGCFVVEKRGKRCEEMMAA